MAALTREHIQVLLDQPGGRGMVVSCYADTSVAEGFQAHWLQPFKTEASRIRQLLAEDHQARLEFERDLEAIRRALESPEARQARGMAVFSAAARDFFLALPSEVPFENRLVVGDEPYVVPLVEAYLREQGYLVILADTHRELCTGRDLADHDSWTRSMSSSRRSSTRRASDGGNSRRPSSGTARTTSSISTRSWPGGWSRRGTSIPTWG